ncbi:hypothetical protein [Helicobacter sp. 11S02596-1]|uniref:hypothetical protein n=1 Tax=Helicobacter sp. 11S02596-1 TaxID=1476194 RepID=UPI000BA79D60|nr:hypothetical protein [Helicobacter sp. 11S02596-1]PAF43623.1 hypothetical protein BJI48_05045 [Helicobacter sp. 11S02596-1]
MTKRQMRYFEAETAILLHHLAIKFSGGLKGVPNIGYLESALQQIKNDDIIGINFQSKHTEEKYDFNY